MTDDRLRRHLVTALDVERVDPALRSRIIASLPARHSHALSSGATWVPQVVATVLAVAMVAGLVVMGRAQQQHAASGVVSCRLPVTNANRTGSGFLSLPDGKYTPSGEYGLTYDAAFGIWLTVPANSVAPDGRSFAYVSKVDDTTGLSGPARLHIVDVRTRSEKVWPVPQGRAIVRWAADGIYVSGYFGTELERIDPTSGESHLFGINSPDGHQAAWTEVRDGYAWGVTEFLYANNELTRLDLSTGQASIWYTWPAGLSLLGLDFQGRPILIEDDGTSLGYGRPVAIVAQNKAVNLGTADQKLYWSESVVADSHGLWISGFMEGIWLYTPAGGLRHVNSESPADIVAGPCV
jgi:hypothetical protein